MGTQGGNTDFNGLGFNKEFPKGGILRGEFQDGHHQEFPLGNPQQRWWIDTQVRGKRAELYDSNMMQLHQIKTQ